MYFGAFSAVDGSPLSVERTFGIEHRTCNLLVGANREHLARVVHDGMLVHSIFEELTFCGDVWPNYRCWTAQGADPACPFFCNKIAHGTLRHATKTAPV